MADLSIAESLNLTVKNGFSENNKIKINFVQGDFISKTEELASKLVPFGKVAFVCYENTFEDFGKPLIDKLKCKGNKPITMIFKNGSEDSIKFASELFNFPEDVRLIIVVDPGLYRLASYFAEVRGTPIVCGLISSNVQGLLDSVIYLKNSNVVDKVYINAERFIIIDEQRIFDNDCSAVCFANIMAKTVALIDYRMQCAVIGEKPSAFIYGILKNAVVDTFGAVATESLYTKKLLLCNLLKAELANSLSYGRLLDSSAFSVTSKLMNGFNGDYSAILDCAKKILGIYEIYFNCKSSAVLKCVDYNERVDVLVKDFGLNEKQCLESLVMQLEIAKKGRSRSESAKIKMKKEVASIFKLSKKMNELFVKLGGSMSESCSKTVKAIKHSGDTFFGLNTMSLAREVGVTEFIR